MQVHWRRVMIGLVLVFGCMGLVALFATGWFLETDLGSSIADLGSNTAPDTGQDVGSDSYDSSGASGARDSGGDDSSSEAAGSGASGSSSDVSAVDRSGNAGGQAADRAGDADLPPFRVLTLQYTPYMATLAFMDAGRYMEALGYDLQLFDVYADDVDLDEEGQCEALQLGHYDALATTLDATRKCGEGVAIAIPIGQSAGNDAIVVKEGVETWNDVFEHAVAFTGYSVSEYMACFASHTANQPMRQPLRFDDASEAVDEWLNSGAEQNIQSVVAWQPEVQRALDSEPGSRVILSSRDVRILWDVIEFSNASVASNSAPFDAFTTAYYRALRDLTADPAGAFDSVAAWAEGDPDREAL
ncbi:MAG: hypothetical protein ACK2T6_09285, partial [Anaerolineae bacterium]